MTTTIAPITPEMCLPSALKEYIGCTSLVRLLDVEVKAAKFQSKALPPIFFHGGPGTGKTTLAKTIAKLRGARMILLHGSQVSMKELDILFRVNDDGTVPESSMLSTEGECEFNPHTKQWVLGPNGQPRPTTVVIFDECEKMHKSVFQALYPAIGAGDDPLCYYSNYQGSQSKYFVPAWTPIFITNHPEQAMKSACGLFEPGGRCAIQHQFEHYTDKELGEIIRQFAAKSEVQIDPDAIRALAEKANGTPRQALQLFSASWSCVCARLADDKKASRRITWDVVRAALDLQGIDSMGLTKMERTYLIVLCNEKNGSMALPSLVAKLGCSKDTVEKVMEPKLVRLDLLRISGVGRTVTEKGRSHVMASDAARLRPSMRITT